jgi:hypothetical protein
MGKDSPPNQKVENMANLKVNELTREADWRGEIQKKLDDGNYIAFESTGILTSKDVLTAIDVVEKLETSRDETSEWNHIRELQYERTKRLAGGATN